MEKQLEYLRRPFHPEDVKFKIQTLGAKSALCVAYIDARHVQDRLNSGPNITWSNEFREIIIGDELKAVEASIHVTYTDDNGSYGGNVSHADVGSFDNVNEKSHGLKALYSDAFKRAAVHFGIAVSLYSLPTMFLPKTKEVLRWNESKKSFVGITEKGEKLLRAEYRQWLIDIGVNEFGKPLPER